MMRLVALLTLFLGLAGSARAEDRQAALDAAKAHWAAAAISNYGFTVQRGCFCPPQYTQPYSIHVRGGKAVGAPQEIADFDTVPKLHAFIQRHIDDYSLRVTYDANGVPTSIDDDPIQYAVDDEMGITVSRFAKEDAGTPRGVDDSIENGTAAAALADARDRWRRHGLRSYRFRQSLQCFCATQYTRARTLTVRRGRPVHPPQGHRPYATAERLFAAIARAIRQRVSGLRVRYAKNGFPRSIAIDPDNRAADEELTIVSTTLRRLR